MEHASLIVLDVHALIWWLSEPSQLSGEALRAIRDAARRRQATASAASILEIATLFRRGRLALTTSLDQWLDDLGRLPELSITPVSADSDGGCLHPLAAHRAERLVAAAFRPPSVAPPEPAR